MTIMQLIDKEYSITRDGEYFDLKLREAARFGYQIAINQIREQEEAHWDKLGIVTPTASWSKWLESLYFGEEK